MTHIGRAMPCAAVLALTSLPSVGSAAWELSGTKTIVAVTADGAHVSLGSVLFSPAADGASSFKVALDASKFTDHFLSMREFKCVQGPVELTCHVPYPYANPGTVTPGNFEWLEHSLLFFYKQPSEFGAKLWNGIYFEFQQTASGLVGHPKAIDLNVIATPPTEAGTPFRPALRDEMPSNARWFRSLIIE